MKQITIGIPAYNSHKTITDTLSSISTFVDIEQASIIIVDDASTETYNQLIQSFLPRLDIQLVRLANQSGPGVARNKVLELCQTPYITFIDSDDIFIDTFFIQQAIKELNQHISMVIYASSFLEQRGNEFNQLMSFD
jgi:glycosyltransferase involved in cell wall biosynthesis